MQSSLSEAELIRRFELIGLDIPLDEIRDIHSVLGQFEAMVATVHAPRPRAIEPAIIFVAKP